MTTTGGGGFSGGGVAAAVAALSAGKKAGANEIVLYQSVAMASGKQSGNPWLLELPDPVTRATWGSYAMISLKKAEELGIKLNVDYEYFPEKPVIKFTANNKEISFTNIGDPGHAS